MLVVHRVLQAFPIHATIFCVGRPKTSRVCNGNSIVNNVRCEAVLHNKDMTLLG